MSDLITWAFVRFTPLPSITTTDGLSKLDALALPMAFPYDTVLTSLGTVEVADLGGSGLSGLCLPDQVTQGYEGGMASVDATVISSNEPSRLSFSYYGSVRWNATGGVFVPGVGYTGSWDEVPDKTLTARISTGQTMDDPVLWEKKITVPARVEGRVEETVSLAPGNYYLIFHNKIPYEGKSHPDDEVNPGQEQLANNYDYGVWIADVQWLQPVPGGGGTPPTVVFPPDVDIGESPTLPPGSGGGGGGGGGGGNGEIGEPGDDLGIGDGLLGDGNYRGNPDLNPFAGIGTPCEGHYRKYPSPALTSLALKPYYNDNRSAVVATVGNSPFPVVPSVVVDAIPIDPDDLVVTYSQDVTPIADYEYAPSGVKISLIAPNILLNGANT